MRRLILPVIFVLVGCSGHNSYDDIGANFLGAHYKDNPLGEEKAPDFDPLIRFDTFDCVTFVETSLANGNIDKLNKIRYRDGNPDFVNRNHFIETDWLENNSNFVENVSNQYAATTTRNITIDKAKWFKTLHNIDTNFVPRNINMEYIPYANVHDIKVSKPVVVLFIIDSEKIRKKIGTDLAVRHMGFLLPNGILRHASRKEKRVIDVDFQEYISKLMNNKNNLGIILLEIKNDR